MNYDLTIKEQRKRFIKRVNALLRNQRINVCLQDESDRTLKQNSYLHILCRIMANETGVSEAYAKQVYFKELANRDLFVTTTKDALTGKVVTLVRSTCDLTIPEMRRAITKFRDWASENGYYLPEANINDDGTITFVTANDRQAFHQAEIMTSKD